MPATSTSFAGCFFFLFGMVGAVWRLNRDGDKGRNPPLTRPFLKDWRSELRTRYALNTIAFTAHP